jgi:hypothetical protein
MLGFVVLRPEFTSSGADSIHAGGSSVRADHSRLLSMSIVRQAHRRPKIGQF